ncbi:MAG: molecular chaperone HtpG [Planctomycetaceae bacterium]|nr:molecular chaperone HtpG [Planctomycetaceae bacterium]
MTAQSEKQQFAFQAEIRQLLHLLSHSLYQNREIAVRELVSNASDALDKYRYAAVTSGRTVEAGELRVWIEPDKDARVLTIRDNGIGMTRDELVANLGTIARSGSLEFLKQAKAADTKDADLSLIGQFGVGFYSSFMLADRVEVQSCSHTEQSGWSWESTGDGNYSITEQPEVTERGTRIRLHLKEGLDEFTDPVRLKYILRKYSTFVPHQIWLDNEHINNQPPIWLEPRSSLNEEQYHNFYEYLTHFPGQKPLWYLHLTADSPFQFHSILFCPDMNLERMGFGKTDHGLHLCAKRILVQNDNRDLLPDYLRFLRGIVDSADLPLNVSREALQDNTVFRKMQKVITRKVLDHLDSFAAENKEDYRRFYGEFGGILREGVANDFDNRERVARLLRFSSTKTGVDGELVSLPEYVERMVEGQEQIYFLTGTDPRSILRDPNLEAFAKRNLEVLLLVDPVDEYMLAQLSSFDDKDLVSIDSSAVKFPGEAASESDDKADAESSETPGGGAGFDRLLELFREALGEQVREVRKSERLTSSACCLVTAEGTMSTTMQRVLRMNTPDFEMGKMILEINPHADFIQRLSEIAINPDNADFVRTCGRQLHSNAMIMAGLAPDGNEMASRVQDFMMQLAGQRSSVAT